MAMTDKQKKAAGGGAVLAALIGVGVAVTKFSGPGPSGVAPGGVEPVSAPSFPIACRNHCANKAQEFEVKDNKCYCQGKEVTVLFDADQAPPAPVGNVAPAVSPVVPPVAPPEGAPAKVEEKKAAPAKPKASGVKPNLPGKAKEQKKK